MRARLLIPVVAAILAMSTLSVGAHAATTTTSWGYIPVDDGVQLRYTVIRPAPTGRFPVALNYGPYLGGSDPVTESFQTQRLVDAGYAVVGVNIRGTGCSTGAFGEVFRRRGAIDGAEAIEWLARQSWSNGRVAMFGLSAPAMLQFGPAGLHPPHLVAMAPFQPAVDLYRDAVYPGGVLDAGFAALWAEENQPVASDKATGTGAASQGDRACAASLAAHAADTTRHQLLADVYTHTFDDATYKAMDPEHYLAAIDVPVLGCLSWQDDAVSSRSFYAYDQLRRGSTWVVVTNGYHGVCDAEAIAPTLVRFLDHFVKGAHNQFERSPHVTVLHDTHLDTTEERAQMTALATEPGAPAWTTTFAKWPVAVAPTRLYLGGGGRLVASAPEVEASERYVSPAPSSPTESGFVVGETQAGWKLPDARGTALTYTTPALKSDVELFGPASVDLWLASSAADTDVQVTISEVRPDGQEVYVQRGWLRASHRAIDPARSTALRPYQTHTAEAAQPLRRGVPTKLRVEVFPFGYVFRAGSSIRLIIDTPTMSGAWVFRPVARPAVNTILHDADHPSALVLGRIPGGHAAAAPQPCDSLLNQPCRPNLEPVPSGVLDLR